MLQYVKNLFIDSRPGGNGRSFKSVILEQMLRIKFISIDIYEMDK